MSKSADKLTYKNEDDRCYGLAGMTLTLSRFGALDRVAGISLDSPGTMVTFAHSYYFTGSPSISPKSAWKNLIDNYYITMGMVIANLMARRIVREHSSVPKEELDTLYKQILDEGINTCSLEEEEVRHIFDTTVVKLNHLFTNAFMRPKIDELARSLARKRTMSGQEIQDEIYYLDLL